MKKILAIGSPADEKAKTILKELLRVLNPDSPLPVQPGLKSSLFKMKV
ncbi:MAG: hypothetical protein MZV64_24470 [Ignavibacteriales bacterium]|nr:hypothetical protein [Ignavibacteriales bacterium]